MKQRIYLPMGIFTIFLFMVIFASLIFIRIYKSTQLHNLGNAAYRSEVLEQALEYYSGSLALYEHSDTRYNYDLVSRLLKEKESHSSDEGNKNTQENSQTSSQQPEQPKETTGGEESEEKGRDESSSSTQQNTQTTSSQRTQDYTLQESQEIGELTPEEEKLLKQAFQELENEQLYYQKFFNKKPQERSDPFTDMQKMFFGDIYKGGEKDW